MKKKSVFKSMLAVLTVALLSVGFFSCSGDSEPTPPPPPESLLVGTWMYSFGDEGYCKLTFSGSDTSGSFTYEEVEENDYDTETGSYTYSNGYLTFSVDGETEKIRVVSLTSDELILKDFPDHGNCSFVKQGTSVSIVGKWKYSFNSGYVLLTFTGSSTSGTVRYQEYDHGKWEDDKTASYQYPGGTNGTLKIYVDGVLEEKIRVVSLTASKLVLKDFPDGGECTYIRQ